MRTFENIEQLSSLFKKCAEDEKDVWRHSNNETSRIRFEARNNVLNQYQKEIEELAGDVLDLCKDLIDANKNMKFEEYHASSECIYMGGGEWRSTILLFVKDYNKLKKVEKDEREGKCRYYYEDDSPHQFFNNFLNLLYERKDNGKTERGIVNHSSEDYKLIREYASSKNTFEYKLCSRLSEYIYNKREMDAVPMDFLQCLAQAVCLYIALKNEQAKLYRQNGYFVDTQTKAAKASTKAKKVELPTELDTEEGRELLQKVINAGFCDENYNWDETKWRDGEDVLALVCFAYKANKKLDLIRKQGRKEIISWKPFDTLFTYRTKLNKESGKTQLQITRTNYMQSKNYTAFIIPNHIERKLAPLFDKH